MTKRNFILINFLLFILAVNVSLGFNSNSQETKAVLTEGKLIKDVYTDKSRYNLSEKVNITIEIENKLGRDFDGEIDILFKHLNEGIGEGRVQLKIKNSDKKQIHFEWMPPKADYTGYLVEAFAAENKNVTDKRNSAIDVSSDWSRFPRYGYLSSYQKQTIDRSSQTIERLNKFHINGLQFYDWQYKHNKPLAGSVLKPSISWKDIAGRDTYGQTVKDYIMLSHSKNIMAANYNLMFGAYDNYKADGAKPEWGLYKYGDHEEQDFHPLPSSWATSKLYIMNPANPDWQKYLFNAEKQAMKVFPFDVWHVDTLGYRGYLYDYNGKDINLFDSYSGFLNNAKKSTGKRILMNAVNELGQIGVAKNAAVDFLYAELWPPAYQAYSDLKRVIDNAYNYTNGRKACVIAAYMNYGRADKTGEFNQSSVKFTDAVIFAAGGAHIELGDNGMLSKEYFPSANLRVPKALESDLRVYYDFMVAYENILRDGMADSRDKIEISNIKTSENGAPDTIWAYSKEKSGAQTIQLLNLLGRNNAAWRDDQGICRTPPEMNNFKMKLYTDSSKVKEVCLASPDQNGGSTQELIFDKGQDDKGDFIEFNVPKLLYWDMIYINKLGQEG